MSRVLDRERHSVSLGISELETEVLGKGLDIHFCGVPSAGSLPQPPISQSQTRTVHCRRAVQNQAVRAKAISVVNRPSASADDGIGPQIHIAC